MKINGIKKHAQVFKKVDPPEKIKKILNVTHMDGGVLIDKDMISMNPNAKREMPYVASNNQIKMKGDKATFDRKKQVMGKWVYCGDFTYVRKIKDEYEYGQYLCYDTEQKKINGLWDARVYG